MEYIFPALSLLAGFHAYTYARWLKKQGNRLGALGVLGLTAAGVSVALYRLFASA